MFHPASQMNGQIKRLHIFKLTEKTYVACFASTHDMVIDTKCITSQKIYFIINFYPPMSNIFFFEKETAILLL